MRRNARCNHHNDGRRSSSPVACWPSKPESSQREVPAITSLTTAHEAKRLSTGLLATVGGGGTDDAEVDGGAVTEAAVKTGPLLFRSPPQTGFSNPVTPTRSIVMSLITVRAYAEIR